ncbi:HNH endonuclease [Blastococcus brunescens]|uniref:HNH endonuclease n=1 Tax=Blastococcus brunescens TaxID=1564165 RepID=A0ABZ1AYM1_9ACTN|nr:HNH endonuclease [Blastococcus sp. BMG 8361]WRL62194.1 HNH endonuclease [Blastococcus sp. BMG 8361]
MVTGLVDAQVRAAMFGYLQDLTLRHPEGLPSSELNKFAVGGRPLKLVVQPGIWKPAELSGALTIRTTYTAPNQLPPYEDDISAGGLVKYAYRGTDGNHSDNRALRTAMREELPLAYFIGVAQGVYQAQFPVYVVGERADEHAFLIAVDEAQRLIDPELVASLTPDRRSYMERLTRIRLHQPVFRARVLQAYESRCAICRLRHPDLLDAAHIIRDADEGGLPVVPNGLSLCKIHHAAYDRNFLGVTPDLVVKVRQDILDEVDGPMLRYGIQAMAGERLTAPRQRAAQPDRDNLDQRYREFLAAS